MTRLQDTIRRARRRHTLNRMLHAAGVGASLGLASAVILLLVERLALGGLDLTWHVYAVIAALGLLLGAIWPLLRVSDLSDIALQLDRALRLKDRVATAHAMTVPLAPVAALRTGPRYDDGFAELVRRDADRVAGIIDVRNVVPIRVTGIWGAAVTGALVLAAAFMFLPSVAWGEESRLSPHERERIAEQREEVQQQREELLATIDEVVAEAGRDEAVIDARTREQLEALERLSEQLRAAGSDEEDLQHLRDESAALMNELSNRLADQARVEELASEKVAERFRALEAPETPMSAEQFTEALRRGDFGLAADSLEELLAQRDRMTPQERRELAEHMQALSQQLDEAGQHDQQELAERAAQLEQALREQGIDPETIEQLLEGLPRSEEQLTDELLDEQIDEDIARRLARELQRLQEQREIEQQAQRDTEAANDALRDAAEQFDDDVPEHDPLDEEPRDPTAPEDEPIDEPREPSDPRDPDTEPSQPGDPDQQRDDPQQPQEQQPEGQAEDDQTQQQREAAEQQQGVEPDETREQEAAEGERQAQPTDDPDAEGEEVPQPDPDAEGEPEQPAPGEGEDPDADPAAQQQQERSASDALREMQQRRDGTQQRRETSERMRERARQMAEGRQREDMQHALDDDAESMPMPGGADGAGESSPPRVDGETADPWQHEIEDIDMRDDDFEGGELIAEWMDPEATPRDGDPQTRRVETEQRVRQAQEIAERAVNEAAVPSRYHERIRRYFGRLNETLDQATETGRSSERGEGSENTQP